MVITLIVVSAEQAVLFSDSDDSTLPAINMTTVNTLFYDDLRDDWHWHIKTS